MLPRVIMSNAVSIDGRIEGFGVDMAQYYRLPAAAAAWQTPGAQAHLVGSNTLVKSGAVGVEGAADAPPVPRSLEPAATRSLLVVPDSRGRIRNWHSLRLAGYWHDVVVLIAARTPAAYRAYLARTDVDYVQSGDEQVDFREALAALYERFAVRTVHLDSGGTLNAVLLAAGLVDELHLLVHPELVGGPAPLTIFAGPPLAPTIKAQLLAVEQVAGGAVWLSYALSAADEDERVPLERAARPAGGSLADVETHG